MRLLDLRLHKFSHDIEAHNYLQQILVENLESKKATRSVFVERIKHFDVIALIKPVLLGKPSKTMPPLMFMSLLLPSFSFNF
jgi:hypothetical protein